MEYTVDALAKVSKISVRTLHYYDEIGLLRPSIRMQSGRRFYGMAEFLRLQQILYFKELGFSLKKIKEIMSDIDVDKQSLLAVQKKEIIKEVNRLKNIITSIDKTIEHYKGNPMTEKEVLEQFESFQKKQNEILAMHEKNFGKDFLENAQKKVAETDPEKLKEYMENAQKLNRNLVAAIHSGLAEDSVEVQTLIKEHYELTNFFNPMSKEQYDDSRKYLLKGSDFYSAYQELDPRFPEFMYKAMGIFIERNFS